jgi:hypothetical protein
MALASRPDPLRGGSAEGRSVATVASPGTSSAPPALVGFSPMFAAPAFVGNDYVHWWRRGLRRWWQQLRRDTADISETLIGTIDGSAKRECARRGGLVLDQKIF